MGAGPLVVTYPLTGRSRTIVEEELGGTAEAIYLVDLPPAARAHALRRAGAVLSHDTSKELQPDEISLIRKARLLQFTAAGVDWVPTRDLPNCRLQPIRAEGPNRCRSTSSRWRWLRQSAYSSSTPSLRAVNSTSAMPTGCCAAASAASSALAMSGSRRRG